MPDAIKKRFIKIHRDLQARTTTFMLSQAKLSLFKNYGKNYDKSHGKNYMKHFDRVTRLEYSSIRVRVGVKRKHSFKIWPN